jgi:hypothetical protein
MAEIKAHPGDEALFSVVPAAAGAYLLSRRNRSSLGTTLGAALAGLGGVGAYQGLTASFAAPASSTITNSSIAPAGSTLSAAPAMPLGPPVPGAAAGPAAGIPGAANYLTNQGVPASVQPYMLHSHPSQLLSTARPVTRRRRIPRPSRREPGCAHDVSLFPRPGWGSFDPLQVAARDAGKREGPGSHDRTGAAVND